MRELSHGSVFNLSNISDLLGQRIYKIIPDMTLPYLVGKKHYTSLKTAMTDIKNSKDTCVCSECIDAMIITSDEEGEDDVKFILKSNLHYHRNGKDVSPRYVPRGVEIDCFIRVFIDGPMMMDYIRGRINKLCIAVERKPIYDKTYKVYEDVFKAQNVGLTDFKGEPFSVMEVELDSATVNTIIKELHMVKLSSSDMCFYVFGRLARQLMTVNITK